jgi:hypothetical protein
LVWDQVPPACSATVLARSERGRLYRAAFSVSLPADVFCFVYDSTLLRLPSHRTIRSWPARHSLSLAYVESPSPAFPKQGLRSWLMTSLRLDSLSTHSFGCQSLHLDRSRYRGECSSPLNSVSLRLPRPAALRRRPVASLQRTNQRLLLTYRSPLGCYSRRIWFSATHR